MADIYTKEKRSEIMSKIRSQSGIEKVPEKLKAFNLRRHPKHVHGNPDFANKKLRVAVFIDGCFWHRCPEHYHRPAENREYWEKKIQNNVVRDIEVTDTLKKQGWTVFRVWEHDIKKTKK